MPTRKNLQDAIAQPAKRGATWTPQKPPSPKAPPAPPAAKKPTTFPPPRTPGPAMGHVHAKTPKHTPDVKQFNTGAGAKSYGGGRPAPNQGKTANMAGYHKRDAMRAAIAKRG